MSNSGYRLLAGFTLLAALSLTACGGPAAADNGAQDSATAAAAGAGVSAATAGSSAATGRVINVEVITAETGAFTEVVRVTGTVQSNREVIISAEEGGVIREVFMEKGARVRAGDSIARVDDRILALQLEQARAQMQIASETWERLRKLYETDKVGTELAYLEAKAAAEQTAANHALLAERIRRTVVRAPIAGTLEARDVEVGTMVATGTPIARIVQLDTLKITGGVPERFALDITRGTPVTVTFDVLPGREFNGRVAFVGATVNRSNRTFPIELSIANNGLSVKPEMVATIEAVRRTVAGSVALPQEALVRVENGFVVYVIEKDQAGVDRAVARPVVTGAAQRNRVVIEEGVKAGDTVVVVGQNQLANGDRIRIVNASPAQQAGGSSR